jgi:hypothetical protein
LRVDLAGPDSGLRVSWEPAAGTVTVALPETPAACLIRLRG